MQERKEGLIEGIRSSSRQKWKSLLSLYLIFPFYFSSSKNDTHTLSLTDHTHLHVCTCIHAHTHTQCFSSIQSTSQQFIAVIIDCQRERDREYELSCCGLHSCVCVYIYIRVCMCVCLCLAYLGHDSEYINVEINHSFAHAHTLSRGHPGGLWLLSSYFFNGCFRFSYDPFCFHNHPRLHRFTAISILIGWIQSHNVRRRGPRVTEYRWAGVCIY